mgnify:FL=1
MTKPSPSKASPTTSLSPSESHTATITPPPTATPSMSTSLSETATRSPTGTRSRQSPTWSQIATRTITVSLSPSVTVSASLYPIDVVVVTVGSEGQSLPGSGGGALSGEETIALAQYTERERQLAAQLGRDSPFVQRTPIVAARADVLASETLSFAYRSIANRADALWRLVPELQIELAAVTVLEDRNRFHVTRNLTLASWCPITPVRIRGWRSVATAGSGLSTLFAEQGEEADSGAPPLVQLAFDEASPSWLSWRNFSLFAEPEEEEDETASASTTLANETVTTTS